MRDIFSNIEQQIENIDAKIEGIVKNAMDSESYDNVSQKINDIVNNSTSAFEKGYARAEKVVKEQSEKVVTSFDLQQEKIKKHSESFKKPEQTQVQKHLFAKKDGAHAGGLAMAIIGFIFAGLLGIGILIMLFLSAIALSGFWLAINRILLIPGAIIFFILGIVGILNMARVTRFRNYIKGLNGQEQASVSELATTVNKSDAYVRNDLKKMISSNWFKEGHLSSDQQTLMVSKAAYEDYRTNKQYMFEKEQRLSAIQQMHEQLPEQARFVIRRGEELIAEIHENKVAISEYEMTVKLSHLESVLKKIFNRVEKHPEVVPQMRKMMDYYLPTTIKLLVAYVQLDKQAIQGTNILAAKTEIEDSLDTLISAYEKLLDDLFEDVMLDVSTDITVLNTMLAQDGLTEGDFGNLNDSRGVQ